MFLHFNSKSFNPIKKIQNHRKEKFPRPKNEVRNPPPVQGGAFDIQPTSGVDIGNRNEDVNRVVARQPQQQDKDDDEGWGAGDDLLPD